MTHGRKPQAGSEQLPDDALVLPLSALDQSLLPLVGGKAARLGELTRAGFAVPQGFCITTAVYAQLPVHAELEPLVEALTQLGQRDSTRQAELAALVRVTLLKTPLPAAAVEAITAAYQALGAREPVAVAVRSSATAEDLPAASFAGQQDTALNVRGVQAVLRAVQRCFASLWTDRAVRYRADQGIDPHNVRLAVVVQQMVQASVAGVLFTANPLTGKRTESGIEANPGLGEAVVSGATNPDHFVVKTASGEIVERRLGDKRVIIQAAAEGGTRRIEADISAGACLSDTQIQELVRLGARVQAQFGVLQDIEWAIDTSKHLFLLQARPITALFPLPAGAPSTEETLRVYLAFGVQQGIYRPFTPLGLSALRLITSGFSAFVGFPPSDPLAGPRFVTEAACRPFLDVTGALRSSFGRPLLIEMMAQAEVHAAESFRRLLTDARLSLIQTPRWPLMRALTLLLIRSRLPWYLLQAVLSPTAAQARVERCIQQIRQAPQSETSTDAAFHLAAAERLLFESPHVFFQVSPPMVAGMQVFALARRLLGTLADEAECQVVLAGSPFNPTVRMNLALWTLAEGMRAEPATAHLLASTPATDLAEAYRAGDLPSSLQQGLAHFLQEYGHLGVADLDLGALRWSEDPGAVLASLARLQMVHDPVHAPDHAYQQAAAEAETMIAALSRRARGKSWLLGRVVGFCLRRAHTLAGSREMPRFAAALLLAQVRAHLRSAGEEFASKGRLSQAADVFFLTLPEAHEVLAGRDLQTTIDERRAAYTQECRRRHVPLVLLSDGTQPSVLPQRATLTEGVMRGTAASPGIATARARVILDPQHAELAPGEILVAPSIDPGWTPLFLTAAGLVMGVGGAMAHGAIVAREYGIPAVVGVPQATERIPPGSHITVDGTAGTVVIESEE
jgi:pyruvate,water dikinase